MRFLALLHDLDGLSHRMPTQNLRELEADGPVVRTEFEEPVRRVEYALSDEGRVLHPALVGLREVARGRAQARDRG